MPLQAISPLTEEETVAGLVLVDPILFREYFFADDLSLGMSKEQKLFMGDQSSRILLCTGRKISKTSHGEAYIIQYGITNTDPGISEALCFTPAEVHLTPIVDRVFSRVERTPLFKMLAGTMRKGDNAVLDFASGVRWYFRIEGTSNTDRKVVGLRAKRIFGDEQAFGSHPVFNSLQQTALPGCQWMLAGVPNGVRGTPFYNLDQTSEGESWSRWKMPTFINPLYQSSEARQKLIDDYGGEDKHWYVTQVLGLWGEELVSSFPPETIAVHHLPHWKKQIASIKVDIPEEDLAIRVGVPSIRCGFFALGWDYGFSPDPSVLVGAYSNDGVTWNVYLRLSMRQVAVPHQVRISKYVIDHIFTGRFVGLSCDNLIVVQDLQDGDRSRSELYHWQNPGGSTVVIEKDEKDKESKPKSVPNKEYHTTFLKSWMVNAVVGIEGRKLFLANDEDVVSELIGTTERKNAQGRIIYYGPSDPNNRGAAIDHNTDALRCLCHAIEAGMKVRHVANKVSSLIGAMGWSGNTDNQNWKAPWEKG